MIKSIFFFKLLFLNFIFFNLNSPLANESVDQDFSYIEDDDDRKNVKLFKNGDLKFDERSKLFFQLRSKLMGVVINNLYVMIKKL